MSEVTMRDCRPEDVEQAAEIAVAAWPPVYAWRRETMGEELYTATQSDWQSQKASQIRAACDDPRMQCCVAEQDGRVVGFVTFRTDPATRVGALGYNAVHPDCQGQGIASRMYRHALDRLRDSGMRFATVNTGGDPAHAPARRAYEKAGFNVQIPWVQYYRKL